MAKLFLIFSALSAGFATVLGAFGAHGLKGRLTENLLQAWQTGVQYQFYHSIAIALVAVLIINIGQSRLILVSGWLFIVGTLLFSGSLYALALGSPKWFGPITPLGGVCFIVGWGVLAAAIYKS